MKRPSATWRTLRLKKPRKQAVLSPTDKVEIRAALNARQYLSTKALAKRFKCSAITIYRLGRM